MIEQKLSLDVQLSNYSALLSDTVAVHRVLGLSDDSYLQTAIRAASLAYTLTQEGKYTPESRSYFEESASALREHLTKIVKPSNSRFADNLARRLKQFERNKHQPKEVIGRPIKLPSLSQCTLNMLSDP